VQQKFEREETSGRYSSGTKLLRKSNKYESPAKQSSTRLPSVFRTPQLGKYGEMDKSASK